MPILIAKIELPPTPRTGWEAIGHKERKSSQEGEIWVVAPELRWNGKLISETLVRSAWFGALVLIAARSTGRE